MTTSDRFCVQGHVSHGFEAVREAFVENFVQRRELGGACCAFHGGEKVADLWGRNSEQAVRRALGARHHGIVHSTTKGLAAMTLAVAHSRGWLDYEQRVCKYWPEFAQNGKERITVRQLLAHQAGLFAFDEAVDRNLVADLDRLAVLLTRQKPLWAPGTCQATGGRELGLRPETLELLAAPAIPPARGFYDECLKAEGVQFSLGFMKPGPVWRFGSVSSFSAWTVSCGNHPVIDLASCVAAGRSLCKKRRPAK